jgi:hypothetical protein
VILELRFQQFTPQNVKYLNYVLKPFLFGYLHKVLSPLLFRPPTVSVLISRSISFELIRECPMEDNWTS